MEVPAIMRLTVTERSPDMEDLRTRQALKSSRPESRRLASTQRIVRARSTICPTVIILERTKLLSCCQRTRRRGMPTRRRRTSKLGATTERRLRTEMARSRTSRRIISESRVTGLADTGSDYSAIPRSAVEDTRKRGFPLKVEVLPEPIMLSMAIGVTGAHHAEHAYPGRKRQAEVQCDGDAHVAVTITTPSGQFCMRGVRQIIVEEEMDHPLIGRPVLDEMGFVAS
jgi:hypothetical protein